MRKLKKIFLWLLRALGILTSLAFIIIAIDILWPSSPAYLILDRIYILGYPLSGYSEQASLMVWREESASIETELNIALVNLRGQPGWNEEWREIAKTAFKVLPAHLKKMVTRERSLRLVIKKEMRGEVNGSYNPLANTIIMEWDGHEGASNKRRALLSSIFHEFGHAVDAAYKDGAWGWPKKWYLSYNEWRWFLIGYPETRPLLEKEVKSGNFYLETFATAFQEYVTDGIFPPSNILNTLPESREWFQRYVFTKEPKREFLIGKK